MLYPVILHADNNAPDEAHRSSTTCAVILDISRTATSSAPRIGVVAFAYLDFPCSFDVGSVTTEEALPYPKMAVAINSRNSDGLYPMYPANYDNAAIGISPAQAAGGVRLSYSSSALLGGDILTALLATTELPDPSDTGRSQALTELRPEGADTSYVMVWSGRASSSASSIRPVMLPSRNRGALRRLVDAGGPSAIVGCWGGHLLSLGIVAPFILNHNGGRFRFSYAGNGLLRDGGIGEGVVRTVPVQYLPHLRCRGEPVGSVENYLFRDLRPPREESNRTLLELIVQGQALTYDQQTQVPMPVQLPSGGTRLSEPKSSVVYTEASLLDTSNPFSGEVTSQDRDVCPMSLSFTLPRRQTSPQAIEGTGFALGSMFTRFGSNNPFVFNRQQEGTRNSELFSDVYGAATLDVEMASDTVRNMIIRAGMDTALQSSRTTATNFVSLPTYAALTVVDSLLRAVEASIPGTVVHNMMSLPTSRHAVTTDALAYSAQSAVAALSTITAAYIEARVQGGGGFRDVDTIRWTAIGPAALAGIDSIIDSRPFVDRSGLTGVYTDKLCNWLQIATTPSASAFIRRCLLSNRARGGLIGIVAASLRSMLRLSGDEERARQLDAVSAMSLQASVRSDGDFIRNSAVGGMPLRAANGLAFTGESVRIDAGSRENRPAHSPMLTAAGLGMLRAGIMGLQQEPFARPQQQTEEPPIVADGSETLAADMRRATLFAAPTTSAGEAMATHMHGSTANHLELGMRRRSREDSRIDFGINNEVSIAVQSTLDDLNRSIGGHSQTVAVSGAAYFRQPDGNSALRATLSTHLCRASSSVRRSPATRSTELRVTVPVELQFTTSLTDAELANLRESGDGAVIQVLSTLLLTAMEHRFAVSERVREGAEPKRGKAASPAKAVKVKRRLVIPDSGNKS